MSRSASVCTLLSASPLVTYAYAYWKPKYIALCHKLLAQVSRKQKLQKNLQNQTANKVR